MAAAAWADLKQMLHTCGMLNDAVMPNNVATMFAAMHNINSADDLAVFEPKDAVNMVKLWNQDPNNVNMKLGMGVQKKVQAWIFWAANRRRCNLPVDSASWNQNELNAATHALAVYESTKGQKVPSELEPGSVETGMDWYTWDEKFENYLAAHIGSATVPLDYVVRRDQALGWDPATDARNDHERRKYQMALAGPEFTEDDKAVYLKLKGFCLDTPAWEWIREYDGQMSGRNAMIALRLHYGGEGEVNKRIGVARATLSTTIYRNEFAYSFEKFATRMKTAFTVLEKHGEPYAETAKVKMLHDRIQVPGYNLIQIAKSQLLDQHGTSFSAAVSYMSRKVAEIFPEAFDQVFKICRYTGCVYGFACLCDWEKLCVTQRGFDLPFPIG
jgi:hypothetical protein